MMQARARRAAVVFAAAAALPLFLGAERAPAHHSSAMFDKNTVREVAATVREFQWTNPHIWIQILVENDDGEVEEWSIEGGGTNTLFRRGWRPNTFEPGDAIRIRFNPMKDGSRAGGFVAAKLADGSTLGNW